MGNTNTTKEPARATGSATPEEIRNLLQQALAGGEGITSLKDFKLDLSASDFHKFFFSAHCSCGTVALLSVEVSQDKTLSEVQQALPALVDRIKSQARTFRSMPCEFHTKMRVGGRTPKSK